ncbi:hypothetical protein QE152_g16934 [Popillia japonica]|uniref:Uncharacterized protein n=1 Tax=Popillia japonica TaxID=7064 RepID=A0AAW1L5H8_POPJA
MRFLLGRFLAHMPCDPAEIVKKFDTTCKLISCVSKNESEYEIDLRTKVNSPDYNEQCIKLCQKENYGSREVHSMIEKFLQKKDYFEEIGVKISIQEDPFCCVLLTPLMQRAHNMRFSSEVVFVDSSGSCDQGGSSVTFLFGASKIGGVPLGCSIHNFQTDEVIVTDKFRDLIGTDGFYGKGFPAIFMTDDGVQPRGTH